MLGGGGYVAGPVGLAAVARRTPLVLTEADSHLGLANRLLAPFARRVCLAFPIAAATASATWSPAGRSRATIVEADRDTARERLGVAPGASLRARVRRQPRRPQPSNFAAVDALRDADAFVAAHHRPP